MFKKLTLLAALMNLRTVVAGVLLASAVAPQDGAQAATIKVRQTVVARQSNGVYDAAYLDGNDSAPLIWGTCPNISLTTADTQSYNLRTLCSLTGTNSLTATLSKLSGTLPTGCSTATNGISCTTPSAAGPNALVWRATDGTPSDSNSFTITVTSTFNPDTTAPTVPTGCSGVGGSGTVTITCDQASDPFVTATGAGSGVASYKIYLDGTLKATVTAPTPNIQQELAGVTVGSADGSQSCTQSGADRAMSGGGAGLGSTTDQLYGCGYAIAGDFIATAKLAAFAGAVTTGTAGLMVRASSAVGSIYGTARGRGSDDKANNRYRATTDAAASNSTLTAAQTYPYWLKMLVSGGSVTAYTSPDGNTFTAAGAAAPLSLGATPTFLAFHASGTAGTNTTSTLQQISIAPIATWSSVVSTTTGGTWTVKAVDAAGNLSAANTGFVVNPTDSGCTGSTTITTLHADDFEYGVNGDYIDSTAGGNTNARWAISDDFSDPPDTWQTVSTNRARYGTRSARTQLTYHDGAGHWYSNGGSENAARNEVSQRNSAADGYPNFAQQLGGDYWYGFSIYLPAAGDAFGDPAFPNAPYPTYVGLTQWHDIVDACDTASGGGTRKNPTMLLNYGYIGSDSTQVVSGGERQTPNDSIQLWNISDAAACTNGTSTTNQWDLGSWLADRGHWTDWVFHWRVNYTAAGILEVWKNGTKVVSYFGPTTNNDVQQNYAKFGNYSGQLAPTAAIPSTYPARIVTYYDEWKQIQVTGNGSGAADTSSCAYQAVAPRGTRQ